MFSEGEDAVVIEDSTIIELTLGSILKHLWLEDSLVKITLSNSHAGYVKMGIPYYGNKLTMVVLFSKSGIFTQELVESHRIQRQEVVTVETYLFYC